ncbi:MAG: riboflavin synthase [Betaproteobacteria bacterium]|nr:riboflavin synthase [Betaproteobacteria bacterium]
MFTGIVQSVGEIISVDPMDQGVRLKISAPEMDFGDVALGDSICVSGACLTVVDLAAPAFWVDVSAETLRCTSGIEVPGPVNLEKAMRLSDRLGGHLVSGHVDGVGTVTRFEAAGPSYALDIRAPHMLLKYIAPKGSVTVDGVSLTVNRVLKDEFSINLIPHTLAHTTLNRLCAGATVNLEADMIARYVERLTSAAEQPYQD